MLRRGMIFGHTCISRVNFIARRVEFTRLEGWMRHRHVPLVESFTSCHDT